MSKTPTPKAQINSDEFDPITAEVIRSALDNITTEMSLVLLRTSGSPVLTESKDFSTVVFDAELNQIGSSGYILLHMSSSRLGVEAVAKARAPHDVQPGDAFICNDPHTSGALHQGDVGIVMPAFHGDKLVGWTFANAHLMDIGGSAISGFAPEARDTAMPFSTPSGSALCAITCACRCLLSATYAAWLPPVMSAVNA